MTGRPPGDPDQIGGLLRAALDDLPDAFSISEPVFDDDGRFVDLVPRYVNRATLARWFPGRTADDVVGRPLFAENPGIRDGAFDLFREVVERGVDWHGAKTVEPPDGSGARHLELRITFTPAGIVYTSRDVTEATAATLALEHANRELAASEERLRLLAENASDVVVHATAAGVVDWASPAIEEVLGWTPAEVVGRGFGDLLHPDDAATLGPVVGELLRAVAVPDARDTQPVRVRGRIRTKRGIWRWMETRIRPEVREDGTVNGLVSGLRDIDEEVRAAAALEAARLELTEAQRVAHVGSWTIDAVTGETTWSDELYRIFGREPGTPIESLDDQAAAHDRAGSDARATRDALYAHTLATGEPWQVAYDVRLPDGTVRSVEARGEAMRDADGAIIGLRGTVADVTVIRAAQSALAESEARFRLVAENAADVVFRGSNAGIIEWVSPSVTTLTGWTPAQLVGRPFADFIHPADHPLVRATQEHLLAGESQDLVVRFVLADGGSRWVSFLVRPILDDAGTVVGRAGGLRDIQAEHEAREALEARTHELEEARDIARLGLWRRDLATGTTEWSPQMFRMFGFDPAGPPPAPADLDARLTPESMALRTAAAAEAARTGEPWEVELEVRRIDGSTAWFLQRGVVEKSADGQVTGYRGTVIDITERKRAEEVQRASAELYRGLVEAIDEGVVIQGRDGAVVATNGRAAEILGLTPEDLAARTSLDPRWAALHEDGSPWPGVEHPSMTVLRTGTPVRGVFMSLAHPDGRRISVRINAEALLDADGSVSAVFAAYRDVTRERDLEERARVVFEGAPVGIAVVDGDGRFVSLNAEAERIIGVAREAMAALPLGEEVGARGPDGTPLTADDMPSRVVLRTGAACPPMEFSFTTPGTARRWVVASGEPLRDSTGTLVGAVMTFTDVTEGHELRAALEDGADLRRHLVDESGEGVIRLDDVGTIIEANVAFCGLLDMPEASVVGRPLQAFFAPEDAGPHRAPGEAEGATRDGERILTGARGRRVLVAWRATRLADGSMLASVRDVGRERDLAVELARSERLGTLGRLTGGVAHDFNNILTAISGTAELLAESVPRDDPRRADVDAIRDAGDRGAALTRQLLALGRPVSSTGHVADLDLVVGQLASMLRRTLGAGIDLRLDLAGGPGPVALDRAQLEQIVVNLVVNARDAMPGGGVITVATGRPPHGRTVGDDTPGPDDERFAWLSVADTGTGISPDVLPHIFDAFYTTKAPGHGTGLGLATIHRVVTDAGGWIDVASDPGKGSTFTIALPVSIRSSSGAVDATADEDAGGTEAILVVEDDEAARLVVARHLRSLGYAVTDAADPAAALALFDDPSFAPDLVVADVSLPGMTGTAMGEVLAARRPGLPMLYISGSEVDVTALRLLQGPRVAFLAKPFGRRQLAEAVRAALERA